MEAKQLFSFGGDVVEVAIITCSFFSQSYIFLFISEAQERAFSI